MPSLLVLLHLCEDLTFVSRDVTAVLQTLLKASNATAQFPVSKHSRKDAWQKLAAGQTAGQQAMQQQSVLQLADRWKEHAHVPGLARLLLHLWGSDEAIVAATQSHRQQEETELAETFQVAECSWTSAAPSDLAQQYSRAAASLGIPLESCVMVTDQAHSCEAAQSQGMTCALIGKHKSTPEGALTAASLLDLPMQDLGLPPFTDFIQGAVPVQPPWTMQGTVVKGFGRGSKDLGIPTANLDSASLQAALAETVTGIYCGWARVGRQPEVHMMVMSIGYNPFYNNTDKTAEAWLLHSFSSDFYDEELRLVIAGYIRPEANFTSVEALIEQIHGDADVTRRMLKDGHIAQLAEHAVLWPERN